MSGYRYEAPLREMRFVIEQVLQAPQQWPALPALADLDMDTAAEVLNQAARFTSEVLQPLNGPGDRQGCRLVDGRVKTPDGFAAAWRAFVDGGWPALAISPEQGGQGLPQLLNAALFEMLAAANHGWTMYPGLLHGACETLLHHGSAELKATYLLTQEAAHRRLLGFLRQSQAAGHALVIVITGKGAPKRLRELDEDPFRPDPYASRGVLRRVVPQWLALPEMRPLVIGFEEAAIGHGGAGALYVRIRRP